MADAIFDGPNLTIQIPSTGTFDVQRDLYSAWKRWAILSDNTKYPKAFDTIGGDEISGSQSVSPYFFARNDLGWKVLMPPENGEIILEGNLFPRDSESELYEAVSGFDSFLRLDVSSKSISTSGEGGLTPEQSDLLELLRLIPGLF